MSLQGGTLNSPTNSPSGNQTDPPATPPGQQSGAPGQPDPQTSPSTPPATGQGQQTGLQEGDDDTGKLSLTKEALDARIEKASRSGVRDHLKALGFQDVDTPEGVQAAQDKIKQLLTYAQQQLDAQMSAEEKVQQQIADRDQRITSLSSKVNQLETDLHAAQAAKQQADADLVTYKRSATVIAAATEAAHPQDVVTWAQAHKPDLFEAVLTDEGTPDEKAAQKVVDACKAERPEYFSTRIVPGSPPNRGAKPPRRVPTDDEQTPKNTTAVW